MAIVKPFNGIRYKEKEMSKLVCPPYDVISPEQKEALKKLSPYNMVRLELSDPSKTRNKYREAQFLLTEWLNKGVLTTDIEPSFYFYQQAFTDHGKKMVRTGFFAALKIENPHKGAIKPHEKTLAKPKADRLSLLKAVMANLSPIFGLYNDGRKTTQKLVTKITAAAPDATAKDKDGLHKLWRVDDAAVIEPLVKLLSEQNVFIADGHHRYETAWNYSQERKAKDKKYSEESEYNYVMIFLCPMEDPGLSIWPTHRVVDAPADFEERIAKYFKVLPAKDFKVLEGKTLQPLLVSVNGKARTLVLKDKKLLAQFMPDKCAAYQNLGVSILHSILLADVAPEKITYVKDDKEAVKLAKEQGKVAVIVPATPIKAMKDIALAGQTMPQKSTYFYPKVATGIVIHSV